MCQLRTRARAAGSCSLNVANGNQATAGGSAGRGRPGSSSTVGLSGPFPPACLSHQRAHAGRPGSGVLSPPHAPAPRLAAAQATPTLSTKTPLSSLALPRASPGLSFFYPEPQDSGSRKAGPWETRAGLGRCSWAAGELGTAGRQRPDWKAKARGWGVQGPPGSQ